MEITLLEDPACGWCWAFQPVVTAIEFELIDSGGGRPVRLRRVMGGLRDRPVQDTAFFSRHWRTAAAVSGMPFNFSFWDRQNLQTTFDACRLVKAALTQGQSAADRVLRRLREAFLVEAVAIDERETLLRIVKTAGIDPEIVREQLDNGRASLLFERDRIEAVEHRFGFPTLVLRKHPHDPPLILKGLVTYGEVLQGFNQMGYSLKDRRRFQNAAADWDRLFAIHERLTRPEVQLVTRLEGDELFRSLDRFGIGEDGPFLVRGKSAAPPRTLPEGVPAGDVGRLAFG